MNTREPSIVPGFFPVMELLQSTTHSSRNIRRRDDEEDEQVATDENQQPTDTNSLSSFAVFERIAGVDPFQAQPSYREASKERERGVIRAHQAPQLNDDIVLNYEDIHIMDHPALRQKSKRNSIRDETKPEELVFMRIEDLPNNYTTHARLASEMMIASTKKSMDLPYRGINLERSASETSVLRLKQSSIGREGTSLSTRRTSPLPIDTTGQHSPTTRNLETIHEQEDFAKNYKVEVRDVSNSDQKLVRSPLKKLFGEKGLLGRTASSNDLSDLRLQKKGIKQWGDKMMARVEEMTNNIHIPVTPKLREPLFPEPSQLPTSLSPYFQGDFYMQLELLLNIETNDFLLAEFSASRLTPASMRLIGTAWRNKGRAQVTDFRYDLATQRELVCLNTDTLQFNGINAFSRHKLTSVLTGWKVLAKEMSVRTFCQPDSAVKKHLMDAEMVLQMIGASADGMMAFSELRTRVLAQMFREQRRSA